MPYSSLSNLNLDRALGRLAELAAAAHLTIELVLCHGVVIMAVYGVDASPSDPAKIVASRGRGDALVRQVTAEQGLPADWLEDDVKFHLALSNTRRGRDLDTFGPGLILSVCAPDRLLATKLHACQVMTPPSATDMADLGFLIDKMGLVSSETVEHLYARFFPGCSLHEGVQLLLARSARSQSEGRAC